MLLAGTNPAAWPNADLALRHHPALRATAANGPRLVDPDRLDELDGIGARAARYRDQLTRGHWQLPARPRTNHRSQDPKEATTE